MEQNDNAAAPETPATLPLGDTNSLATYREAKEKGETEIANPAAKQVTQEAVTKPVETPEQEADSLKPDTDVSEAGRKLRSNRADKRAEKIREDNDALARELHRRQELNKLRSELDRPAPGQPAASAAPSAGTTPQTRPKPSEDEVGTKYATYGDYVEDLTEWKAEQREAAALVTRHQEQVTNRRRELSTSLAETVTVARAKFSDYDAVIDPVITAISAHPRRDEDFTEFVAKSKAGGELVYRLGKDATALQSVLGARSFTDLTRALTAVEVSILAPPKESPKPVTSAPDPHTPVGSAGSASATDPKNINDLATYRKNREQLIGAGR